MNIKQTVESFYDKNYGKQEPKQESKQESIALLWTRERELNNIFRLIKKNDKVLDLGCGDGEPAIYLAKKAKSVIGIDISNEAIKRAIKKSKLNKAYNCSFYQGDAEMLKYPKNSFDFILCLGIFEYYQTIDKSLKKIYKLLRPGGMLYFHVWNKDIITRLKQIIGIFDKNKPFKRHPFSADEIEKTIIKNGFIIKNSYGQLIAVKLALNFNILKIGLMNKKLFNLLEYLGRFKLFTNLFAGNLVYICEKPQAFH